MLTHNIVTAIHINSILTADKIIQYIPFLDNARQERIHKLLLKSDNSNSLKQATTCLFSGLLIYHLLNSAADIPSSDRSAAVSSIKYNEKGKPYIENSPFSFNISHSGDFVIGVLSPCLSGIDIEYIKSRNSNLAKRFFAQAEIEALDNLSDDTKKHLFYKIWTRKESLLKLEGSGISVPLDSFCVLEDTCNYNNRPHHFITLDIHPQYAATLCTDRLLDTHIILYSDMDFLENFNQLIF